MLSNLRNSTCANIIWSDVTSIVKLYWLLPLSIEYLILVLPSVLFKMDSQKLEFLIIENRNSYCIWIDYDDEEFEGEEKEEEEEEKE